MTEQPASGTVTGIPERTAWTRRPASRTGTRRTTAGAISWVAAAIVIVGFIVGGIALPIGPSWWLFWVGAAIVVIGGIIGAAARIMDDWY